MRTTTAALLASVLLLAGCTGDSDASGGDEIADDPEDEMVPAGEHTGYVSTQSDVSCDLNVETDTATVGVALTLESEQLGEDEPCEVAADAAETVIGELGW